MEDRLLTESLILSCIYQDLTLVVDTNLKIENFSTGKTSFYYQLAIELNKNIKTLDELSVMSYVSTNGLKDLYEEYGGYRSIKNLVKLANVNNFESYVDNLKKYLLIENLKEKRNFDVYEKVMYDGMEITPSEMLPHMSASDFHNFIQLLFEDLEVEIDNKDIVKENMYYSDDEIEKKINGEVSNTNHFDVVLDWEDEKGEYRYLQSFKLLNDALGGLQRQNGVHVIAATSGGFKTTTTLNISMGLVTTSNAKVIVASNEQQVNYYRDLMLSMICHTVFKCSSLTRKKITRSKFDTQEEIEVFKKANKFIKEKFGDNLQFIPMASFNKDKLGRLVKREKLKNGVSYFVFDTMKFEGGDGNTGNIAIELVETSRHLDQIGTKYDCGIIMPMQLLVSQDKVSFLTSASLANSKQVKEVCNSVLLMRRIRNIEWKSDDKYFLDPYVFRKDMSGRYIKKKLQIIDSMGNEKDKNKRYDKDVIDINNQYVLLRIDKNRAGEDNVFLILEVNGNTGVVKEKGYANHVYMGMLGD